MTRAFDVLVVESEPGAARAATAELTAAGSRVHTCHRPNDEAFPCVGLVNAKACPLVADLDVALLVRDPASGQPTLREDGVRCAIRAGLPLVELNDGPTSPFSAWVTAHASQGRVARDVEVAVDRGWDGLRREIRRRLAPSLTQHAVDDRALQIDVEAHAGRLDVRLRGLDVGRRVAQQLAVRAFDAIRLQTRTFRQVAVSVDGVDAVLVES